MGRQGYQKLLVWNRAKDLAIRAYLETEQSRLRRDLSLRDQVRKSAVSIASNIAEGEERNTDRESVQFFYIAKGSLAELRTQILIASATGHLEPRVFHDLDKEYEILGKMLGSLIRTRQHTSYPAPRASRPIRQPRDPA